MRGIRVAVIAAVLLLTLVSSASATTWTDVGADQSLWFTQAANSVGNGIFVPGGLGFPGNVYGPLATNSEYFGSGEWDNVPALPSARFGAAVVASLPGSPVGPNVIYSIGGENKGGTVLAGGYRMDGGIGSWLAIASLPSARVALSAAVPTTGSNAGDIYTFGGDTLVNHVYTPTNTVEIYTPGTNSWTAGPSLPVTLDDTAASAVGSTVYVFGGWHNGPQAQGYALDTGTPGAQWQSLPNMPSAADLPGAAVDANGLIYVIGGANDTSAMRRVDIYDTTNQKWTCIAGIPQGRIGAAVAVSDVDGFPAEYAIGGLNGKYVYGTAYMTPVGTATDTTPPVVTSAPSPHIVSGVQAGPVSFPVAVGWGRSDAGTDILADNLQESVNGSVFGNVLAPWAVLDPGYFHWGNVNSLRFQVTPTDCNGNTDPAPSTGPAFSTRIYSEAGVHYAGKWSELASSLAQGGHYRASSEKNDVATFKFTGRDVGLLAFKGPSRGQAYVAVNGVRVATINLYAKGTQPREVVWHRLFTTVAARTLTVKVVGTAGHPSVDIDSMFVLGNPIAGGASPHALSAAELRTLTHATTPAAIRQTRPGGTTER